MAKERKRVQNKEEDDTRTAEERLNEITKHMDKVYGKGAVMKGNTVLKVPRWEVSSPNIGYVLGDGGVPKGRIIELIGSESGGKTTVATFLGAEIQKQGGIVAVIDAECAFDMDYAETLGLQRDLTLYSQPSSGEEALDIVHDMAGEVDFVIVDSVSALIPQAELEGSMSDQQMGVQARMMGKAMRKITPALNGKTTLCFINQIREKIGVMYGNPETTSGGRALKFFASIRLDVRRVESIMDNETQIGLKTRIKGNKNKTAPPFRKAEIEIIFGKGIQYEAEYRDFAVHYGIIKKSASYFYFIDSEGNEIDKVQGKDNATQYLKDNPEYFEYVKEQVKQAMNPTVQSQEEAVPLKESENTGEQST